MADYEPQSMGISNPTTASRLENGALQNSSRTLICAFMV